MLRWLQRVDVSKRTRHERFQKSVIEKQKARVLVRVLVLFATVRAYFTGLPLSSVTTPPPAA